MVAVLRSVKTERRCCQGTECVNSSVFHKNCLANLETELLTHSVVTKSPKQLILHSLFKMISDFLVGFNNRGPPGCRLNCSMRNLQNCDIDQVTTGWFISSDSWVWLTFNFCCSTVCLVLLGLMVNWQDCQRSWGGWWNIIKKINPTQLSEEMDHPVVVSFTHPSL